jgi:hypothetical protein
MGYKVLGSYKDYKKAGKKVHEYSSKKEKGYKKGGYIKPISGGKYQAVGAKFKE